MSILQKIVEEMYVEPELLAQLNEEQKQILFCKMREEQIRKYSEWDVKMDEEEAQLTVKKNKGRHVQFLMGTDGEPWTWVMGDVEGQAGDRDSAILSMTAERVREAASKRLRDEEEKLKEALRLEALEAEKDRLREDAANHVEDEPSSEATQILEKIRNMRNTTITTVNTYPGAVPSIYSRPGQTVIQTLDANTDAQQRMQREIAEQQRREELHLNEKNSTVNIQPPGRQSRSELIVPPTRPKAKQPSPPPPPVPSSAPPDLDEAAQERIWQEQERKAKEREREIRDIARRARAQHHSNSLREASVAELADQFSRENLFHSLRPTRPLRPPNRQSVIDWFRSEERSAGTGLDPVTKKASPWFHGIITRIDAERLLGSSAEGTFLVRVSERIWGFAISVRSLEKVKHYLVERVPEGYQLMGTNMLVHRSLWELVMYHKDVPLKEDDYLKIPLGQTRKPADFVELLPPSVYE